MFTLGRRFVSIFLFAGVALAQQQPAPRPPELLVPPVNEIAEPAKETPPESPEAMPALQIPRLPAEVTPHESGSAGDVLVDGSVSPYGVYLHAKTSGLPSIGAKLGTNSASSAFNVFDSDGSAIWSLTPGQAQLIRNQNAVTSFIINNGNPGATGVTASAGLWYMEGASLKSTITVFGSGWTDAPGGPNALRIMNFMNAPILFWTNNAERMRITADGNLAIGATSTTARLRTMQTSYTAASAVVDHSTSVNANMSNVHSTSLRATALQNVGSGFFNESTIIAASMYAANNGPGRIQQTVGQWITAGVDGASAGTVDTAYGAIIDLVRGNGTLWTGFGLYITDVTATNGYSIYQLGANDKNYFAGRIGIGNSNPAVALDVTGNAHVTGDMTVDGNIGAKYQDVAEWVPSREDLQPGTVVILDPSVGNTVTMSRSAYDTTVAGVVSEKPGIILGIADAAKEQIATTGRVKVRVDATAAPIRIGDLLVTGNKPGVAMKSQPIEVGGALIHRPGTIVGKALEPLPNGQGEILVLLSLQ